MSRINRIHRLGRQWVIAMSSFSKNTVFKMFFVNTETQADVFKLLQLEVCFRDGLEKKVGLAVERAVFSNFSIVVWTQPEFCTSFSHKIK